MRFLVNLTVTLLLLFMIAAPASAEDADGNVVYGMVSGLALLMDVYRPDEPNGYGLVVIPGSGWEGGLGYGAEALKDSYEVELVFGRDRLVAAGYTLFVINHRQTPMFRYPAPIEDARRAVRFVRHHASDYGIDADRIGVIGGSSGGHAAAMLATTDGSGDPDAADPVARTSAQVQAVALLYPVVDLLGFRTSNPWAAGAITALMGPVNPAWKPPPLQDPEARSLYAEASPITHVSAGDPPTLLIHGDADMVVPFSQSETFEARLREAGVATRLIRLPGAGHGPNVVRDTNPDYVAATIAWFDEYLAR